MYLLLIKLLFEDSGKIRAVFFPQKPIDSGKLHWWVHHLAGVIMIKREMRVHGVSLGRLYDRVDVVVKN